MERYLDILKRILNEGVRKKNRTGIDTIAIAGAMFEHDMKDGFPLLTTKKVPYKNVRSEMEFFVRGLTDKKWLQERGNPIWNQWCSPEKVPYGHDPETKAKMMDERDLGPVYGWQWRHFGAEYVGFDKDYTGQGVDQLSNLVRTLKSNPSDRRMIVTAWNPSDLSKMALPPCHHTFQVTVDEQRLNLIWMQRSVDSALGLPFNIASYATLLHLLARETGLEEGKLVGQLADTHLYVNHLDGIEAQLERSPRQLPTIKTSPFKTIFDWNHEQTALDGYDPHPAIKFQIAV